MDNTYKTSKKILEIGVGNDLNYLHVIPLFFIILD